MFELLPTYVHRNRCGHGQKLLKRHCTSSSGKTYHGDQWVSVEIEVEAVVIRHIVEGKTVLEYTQPQLDNGKLLEGGTISLQSESHPVEFRKVELRSFQKTRYAKGLLSFITERDLKEISGILSACESLESVLPVRPFSQFSASTFGKYT